MTLLREPAHVVPVSHFKSLRADDILFSDSTHVAKGWIGCMLAASSCLLTLAGGVLVRIHDIFWLFTYPETWLRDGRDWNESYLLNALLLTPFVGR